MAARSRFRNNYCYTATYCLILSCIQGLSPIVNIIHICPNGQLSLSCVSNSSLLEWTMMVQDRIIGRRLIPSGETSDNILPLSVNQTKFNFTLESRQPLNVTLSVLNVSVGMSIVCTEYYINSSKEDVEIVDVDVVQLSRPELILTESTFGENNYSINIQVLEGNLITEEILDIVFTIKPPSTIIANNDSATLILSYNTQYNVTVTVFGTVDACGYYDSASTTLSLSYANCGAPTSPQNGYINPYISTIEGAEINITCLIGWNEIITCDHEGNWIPNPTAACTDIYMDDSGAMPIKISPIIVGAICGLIIIIIIIFIIITYAFCVMIRRRQQTSKETTHGAVGPVRWRGSRTRSDDEDMVILPLDDSCSTELASKELESA